MKKQTSVEWLKLQLETYGDPQYCELTWKELDELVEQAKEMEREQRLQDFKEGFQTAVDSLQAANNSVQSRKIKGGEQ